VSDLTAAESLDGLCGKATPLLRRSLGDDVELQRAELIKDGARCVAVRCAVRSARTGITSVILKRRKPVPEGERVFTDWASLSFLTQLPGTRGIAPRFYGGDPEEGLYAIEDLGGSRSLEDVLMGRDPAALRKTLRTLAVRTAQLHARTMGTEAEFARACRSLPGESSPGRRREAEQWLNGRPKIDAWFAALQRPLPPGFDRTVERIAALYAEPGPFLAFTHGDPAPTNNHVADDDVRLLDFEFGGFRHALYDLTAWYVLCPLPERLVHEMSQVYRSALAASCSAAKDEEAYQEAWAHLCAYRALAMLTWISPGILAENQPWVGDWTRREAVLAAVSRLFDATSECPLLAPVAEAADGLWGTLRSRWSDYGEVLPRWPALCSEEPSGCPT
jgi:Phosphotransferase enzyme family